MVEKTLSQKVVALIQGGGGVISFVGSVVKTYEEMDEIPASFCLSWQMT